jgi:DNA-directed RNA polymerase specialized sigma24 family protein
VAATGSRILGGTLRLHGVDAELLIHRVIRDAHLSLSDDDYQDLFAELLEAAWRFADTRAGADGPERQRAFTTGCYRLLKLRIVDWRRRTHGRTRWQFAGRTVERERRPDVLSLEGLVAGGRELGDVVGAGTLDDDAHSAACVVRALARGGREAARALPPVRDAAA